MSRFPIVAGLFALVLVVGVLSCGPGRAITPIQNPRTASKVYLQAPRPVPMLLADLPVSISIKGLDVLDDGAVTTLGMPSSTRDPARIAQEYRSALQRYVPLQVRLISHGQTDTDIAAEDPARLAEITKLRHMLDSCCVPSLIVASALFIDGPPADVASYIRQHGLPR